MAPNKGCVERNWPTVLREVSPVAPGPLFLLSKEPVHCLLALGFMSGAICHMLFHLESLVALPTIQASKYIPQKVEVFIFPDFSAYLMKCLSAVPQSEGMRDRKVSWKLPRRPGQRRGEVAHSVGAEP